MSNWFQTRFFRCLGYVACTLLSACGQSSGPDNLQQASNAQSTEIVVHCGSLIDGLSDGSDSFLLESQEEASMTYDTVENPNLENVTDIITYLVTQRIPGGDDDAPTVEEDAPEQSPESSSAPGHMSVDRVAIRSMPVALLVLTAFY